MRYIVAFLSRGAATAAVLLLVPGIADAATVTVRPDPGTVVGGSSEPAYDKVHYVAGAAERNRLLVSYAGDSVALISVSATRARSIKSPV